MSGPSEKSISQYKGIIGEIVAAKYLEKNGYTVGSHMILADSVGRRPSKFFARA